jgi:hypothetical protein
MASTTARVLAAAVLLLTCAPLTSIYSILVSNGLFPGSFLHDLASPPLAHKMTNAKNHERKTSTTASPAAAIASSRSLPSSSFEKILQNPNSTLEELWAALFRQAGIMTPGGMMMGASSQIPAMQVHHWTIIIPWGMSLLLGVVIPCILSLMNYFRPDHHDPDDPWVSRLRKNERRLSRLLHALKHHRKVRKKGIPRDSGIRESEGCLHNRFLLHCLLYFRSFKNPMWT